MSKKRIITSLLIILLVSVFSIGCVSSDTVPTTSTKEEPKQIELTIGNIRNYIQLEGSFTEGQFTMYQGSDAYIFRNHAEAMLNLDAYSVVPGKYSNVEIEIVVSSKDSAFTYMNDYGNYWHLIDDGEDAKEIRFSFRLGADGRFSKKYQVQCWNNTDKLAGNAEIEVVRVTGTYIQE